MHCVADVTHEAPDAGVCAEEAGRIAERAGRDMDLAVAKARAELRTEAVTLASDMCSKILGREVTSTDHQEMLDGYIAEVEKRAGDA